MSDETTTVVATAADTNGADEASKKKRPGQSYFSLVKHQFKKNKLALLSLYFIFFMFGVALLADVLANEKPIACSYKGEFYMPVFKDYAVGLGLSTYPAELVNADWPNLNYDWKISAPIPYSAGSTDLLNSFAPPFSGNGHLLGADQLGRDILSGLIHGSRISLSIGFISMGIAAGIGVILWALAG